MSFNKLGLSEPILDAIAKQGYTDPTPIQEQVIPHVLKQKDIMAEAQTGTGKTAAFALPILELLKDGPKAKPKSIRTLILTPTRELALQIADNIEAYGQKLPLKHGVVYGGVKSKPQINMLRQGVDVLIATPGRLIDLFEQKAINFSQVEILVLDEADRMLDMGFIRDINKILRLLPSKRQNMLFSATFSNEIRKLAVKLVHDPVKVSVTPPNATADTVEQWVYPVDKSKKTDLLVHLIKKHNWFQVLVFSKTKRGADRLARILNKNEISSAAIHGDKSQGSRIKSLANFKSQKTQVLVATDIAARGIDIDQLPHVINFNLPHVAEDYVHRIGRTGRAGSEGIALSLVCADEYPELANIEWLIKKIIPRVVEEGFEAKVELEESTLDRRPPRVTGPKQKQTQSRNKKTGFSKKKFGAKSKKFSSQSKDKKFSSKSSRRPASKNS